MSFIRTIFNDVQPSAMQFTYSHEHIFCSPPHWVEQDADDFIINDIKKSTAEVQDFIDCGGQTIVDATVIDYGRNIREIIEIEKDTGVTIIATTGFNKRILWNAKIPHLYKAYTGDYDTFYDWLENSSVNTLSDYLIREIEEGIDGSTARAGQLKFGTWYNSISPLEEKTICAIAQAYHHTKAPIHSHTEAGTMGLEQIALLEKEGVPINHISLGHMDRNLDYYYYEKIAEKGAYMCFDGIGKIKYAPEGARIQAILHLCNKGFEDSILISGDLARRSYYKNYECGIGFEFIIKKWIPRFIEEANSAGFNGESLIQKFFYNNPQRCFAFKS